MDGYLAKPVSKDALLALVSQSLKHGPAVEVTIDPTVLEELRVIGGSDDQDFLDELVDQFAADTEPLLVELREALEAGDAVAVRRLAHNLKGSSGQLGGRRLASSCDRLERKASDGRLSDDHSDLKEVEVDYQDLRRTLTQQVSTCAQ
jgi:HPt (histidine-containing phosphotransfer) domain-containing protein